MSSSGSLRLFSRRVPVLRLILAVAAPAGLKTGAIAAGAESSFVPEAPTSAVVPPAEPIIVPPAPLTTNRTLYYFPPVPPRLWAPLPGRTISAGRFSAPEELKEFVGEPFYAPLGTRLAQDSLTAALQQRLEAYHRERDRLHREIVAVDGRVREADLATRESAWTALAASQQAALEAHEDEAEALRRDLIRSRDDWGSLREWRLGSAPFGTPGEALSAQYQVFRAASFYQRGLSPAQRRLLREIMIDMETMIELPLFGDELPSDLSPLLNFSPESARIRLPSALSPEVSALVTEYEQEKSVLKQELRDLLYAEDDAMFGFMRVTRLEQLARAQETRFARVEILAERLRKALAASGYREPRIALPSLPPPVVERLDRFLEAQREIDQAVMQTVSHLQTVAKIDRVAMRPTEAGRYEVHISLRNDSDQAEQMAYVRRRLDEFNTSHTLRQANLETEREALHKSMQWLDGSDPADPRAEHEARRLVASYTQAVEQIERVDRFRMYQLAAIEPGLSPAQRRLLFSVGLVDLELPLPSATQPPASGPVARQRRPARDSFMSSSERMRNQAVTAPTTDN